MLIQRRISVLRPSLLTAAWLLAGCTRSPEPIAYGRDACDYCRMIISDQRYGAELVTAKGKVHKFDSIECLASYYLASRGGVSSVWVTDFQRPGTLVPAEAARYLRVRGPGSPMGKGLMAFSPVADAAGLRRTFGGDTLRWADVLTLVEREGLAPRGNADAEAGAHAR